MQDRLREDARGLPRGVTTVTRSDRRAQLLARHRLSPNQAPATVAEIAESVIGLHATEPTTVYLSAWARHPELSRDDVDTALYDERSVVRVVGMRRTMFVVTPETATLVDRACSRAIAARERRNSVKILKDADAVADPEGWVDRVSRDTVDALEGLGEATASELTKHVPDLGLKVSYGEGRKWAGEVGMSTRILYLLSAEGRIVRGRPRGSWLSSQYRWSTMDRWVDLPASPASDEDLRAELVRRYVDRFGPVTETDVAWWTGWTKTQTRAALGIVGPAEVDLEGGGTGYVLPGFEPGQLTSPTVTLLPGLDATVMGWKERDWYLGEHGNVIFDSRGNAGPTVWADGRVVGGWGQTQEGEVVWRLLEDLGADYRSAIEEQAARVGEWLDGTVIANRFPSPLQKDLAAASSVTP